MQTFLPYPDFARSAACLDYRRLGKQRVECKQILNALAPDSTSRWRNHSAVRMWKNHELVLSVYGSIICSEWIARGYKDSLYPFFKDFLERKYDDKGLNSDMPFWLGDEEFHRSHRSNLLRKYPEFYGPLFEEDLNPDLPYIWPIPRPR